MMSEIEEVQMVRPLTLTYTDTSIFGTKASKAAIAGCYDQGWILYKDLMESNWEQCDAMRSALHCIIANMTAAINMQAELGGDE